MFAWKNVEKKSEITSSFQTVKKCQHEDKPYSPNCCLMSRRPGMQKLMHNDKCRGGCWGQTCSRYEDLNRKGQKQKVQCNNPNTCDRNWVCLVPCCTSLDQLRFSCMSRYFTLFCRTRNQYMNKILPKQFHSRALPPLVQQLSAVWLQLHNDSRI